MSDHHGPSPTFSQTQQLPHLASSSSPGNYLHHDRSGSLTLPTWVDTTQQSQHNQHQPQSMSSLQHRDTSTLSGPGSTTLFNGGTPLMTGPGGMMLPPPTPFGGTSGTGTGFLDPSTLSTSALPLDSGKSPLLHIVHPVGR